MVEELAKMLKGFEWQVNSKKPDIENLMMNMMNLSRKVDEN